MALVDQVQTFLVTAYPEIVVLIFDDIVDEGGSRLKLLLLFSNCSTLLLPFLIMRTPCSEVLI